MPFPNTACHSTYLTSLTPSILYSVGMRSHHGLYNCQSPQNCSVYVGTMGARQM